jgi:hypothetical protein
MYKKIPPHLNQKNRAVLEQIFAESIRQGSHFETVEELYRLIRAAAVKAFSEDAAPSIDSFLRECFEETQDQPQLDPSNLPNTSTNPPNTNAK